MAFAPPDGTGSIGGGSGSSGGINAPPVTLPNGSTYTLYITTSKPMPVETLSGLPLYLLVPNFAVGQPTQSGSTIAIPMMAKAGTTSDDAAKGIAALISAIAALIQSLFIGIVGFNFVASGGAAGAGKAAAAVGKTLGKTADAIGNAPSIIPLLLALGAAYIILENF